MNVIINQQATTLPAHATVQDALATLAARPPFAVAVNTRFVPNTQYASHTLHEGDRIAADAVLVDGQLEVDESLLTGEAVPVAKQAAAQGAEAPDNASRLFASTVVTRGVGVAQVHAVAAQTAVGRIGADLATTVEPPSALQSGSRKLVRALGLAAVVLASAQVLLGWWWNDHPLLDSLL